VSVGKVGEVVGSWSLVPDGDEVADGLVLGVWLGVAVFDFVGVSLGLGERDVRCGVLVWEGVAAGGGATLTVTRGGRTSR
jgi:hypothetical protein